MYCSRKVSNETYDEQKTVTIRLVKLYYGIICGRTLRSNKGNQGFSGNQKNAIQGQRPDMENGSTQQRP